MNRRAFLLGSAAAISAGAVARTLVMDIDPICGVSVLEPPVLRFGDAMAEQVANANRILSAALKKHIDAMEERWLADLVAYHGAYAPVDTIKIRRPPIFTEV